MLGEKSGGKGIPSAIKATESVEKEEWFELAVDANGHPMRHAGHDGAVCGKMYYRRSRETAITIGAQCTAKTDIRLQGREDLIALEPGSSEATINAAKEGQKQLLARRFCPSCPRAKICYSGSSAADKSIIMSAPSGGCLSPVRLNKFRLDPRQRLSDPRFPASRAGIEAVRVVSSILAAMTVLYLGAVGCAARTDTEHKSIYDDYVGVGFDLPGGFETPVEIVPKDRNGDNVTMEIGDTRDIETGIVKHYDNGKLVWSAKVREVDEKTGEEFAIRSECILPVKRVSPWIEAFQLFRGDSTETAGDPTSSQVVYPDDPDGDSTRTHALSPGGFTISDDECAAAIDRAMQKPK